MNARETVTLCACALALAAHAQGSLAQAFPAKPVRLITQFSAGASGDTGLRTIAGPLSELLGQPVVVENRAGASGVVAAEAVRTAAPDGYTIFGAASATQVIRPFITKTTPFDPVKDFTPITQTIEAITVLVSDPSLPVNSLRELLDYARKNPGKVGYGTSGIGSEHHLSGEELSQLAGVQLVHVPYKASAQGLLDVVSGRLQSAFAIYLTAMPSIKSGKVKALAVVRDKRTPRLPDLPAVSEIVPGFEPPPSWVGIFGPANMPAPIVQRLNGDIVKVLNMPEPRSKLVDQGLDVVGSTPAEFAAKIERQKQLVARIVKSAGIQPQD